MNVQHERTALTNRLNSLRNPFDEGEVAPTGRAFVDATGYLWYEFATTGVDAMDFWATRESTTLGERYTIAHNQTEMEEAF